MSRMWYRQNTLDSNPTAYWQSGCRHMADRMSDMASSTLLFVMSLQVLASSIWARADGWCRACKQWQTPTTFVNHVSGGFAAALSHDFSAHKEYARA